MFIFFGYVLVSTFFDHPVQIFMSATIDKESFCENTGFDSEVVEIVDVFHEGMQIRSSEEFRSKGVNVTFTQRRDEEVFIRTYERGVEAETLSCGTAVVAAAISIFKSSNNTLDKLVNTTIKTRGGLFYVKFKYDSKNQSFTDIFLSNQVNMVFEGEVF